MQDVKLNSRIKSDPPTPSCAHQSTVTLREPAGNAHVRKRAWSLEVTSLRTSPCRAAEHTTIGAAMLLQACAYHMTCCAAAIALRSISAL
jgi:hypothetical protein